MKHQRALWATGALVLALHWLVLDGLPWRSSAARTHAPGPVFATRTLAPPQPPPPPAPAATIQPTTPQPSPVRPAPPKRKATAVVAATPQPVAPPPAEAPEAPATGPDMDTTAMTDLLAAPQPEPDAQAQETAPETTAPPDAAPTLRADATTHSAPARDAAEAPAAAPPASAPAAPAPAAPAPAGAIDIVPPGPAAAGPASQAAPAVRIPPPMRLQFDVTGQAKKFQYSARAELLWQHDGQRYQAQQEISMLFLGARAQTSVGTLGPTGLLPQRFGDRARSEQAAHFDYAQGRVTFSANTPDAPLATGTQDRLSVFLQLGALLAAAPERYPAGTRISVATVSARAADVWSFTVQGAQTLELPDGTLETIPLERLPRRDHDQTAQVWLAPALGYLPVRIRIVQANGDFADLRLREHAAP